MENYGDTKKYIVINANDYLKEEDKPEGYPAEAILGVIKAQDQTAAEETASSVFPGIIVLVKDWNEASDEYRAAAEELGYLNTSESHIG